MIGACLIFSGTFIAVWFARVEPVMLLIFGIFIFTIFEFLDVNNPAYRYNDDIDDCASSVTALSGSDSDSE